MYTVIDKQERRNIVQQRTEYFREYMQVYREENKQIVARARRNWQEKNKEHLKNYMREYRAKKKAEKN